MTLKKIAESGLVTIGFREGSIPFSYLDARQRPVGYSMELCERIVDAVKRQLQMPDLDVKLTPVNSSTRIPLLVNGAIDMECGTTTNTLARQKDVAFLLTSFVATSRLLSKRSTHIEGLDDLRQKAVVSTAGTTTIVRLVELNAERGLQMKLLAGRDHAESFRMVESDRAAAFAMDDVLLYAQAASAKKPAHYHLTGEALSIEPYGIMVRRNDPVFKKLGDDTLRALFRSGEIRQIYQRWFQSPIPPRGINLQLPMNAHLEKAVAQPTDSGDPDTYR